MNVQAAPKTGRIPTAAVTGLIVDAMMKSGVPAADAAKIAELMLEADLRRRCAWRVPPTAICAAAEIGID